MVGSTTDNYTAASGTGAYEVFTAYNAENVTWNSFNNGGVAGVNYSASAIATGVIAGSTTSWDFSSIVQNWVYNTSINQGLYFANTSIESTAEFTGIQNVNWILGAEIVGGFSAVPKPSTLALMGIGLAGFAYARRKKAS